MPPLGGTSVATAGLVDSGVVPAATATISYTAQLVADTSFEVDYWNGSQLVEDVQGGALVVMLQ